MRKLIQCVLMITFLGSFCEVTSQEITVQGTVTDESGAPLPGASVILKNSSIGTLSNFDGEYSITVPDANAVLVYNFVGFAPHEEIVGTRETIDVALQTDLEALNEVVIVGYGTQERSTVTSAITSVSGEELERVPTNTVSSKLQGRLAGVSVSTGSGQPGNELTIRVRGGSSINKSNSPLVIVDGLQRSLTDLNPNDIESINVLKDAAATAIYGSRASNGVILVTTKSGVAGKTKINIDIAYNLQDYNRQYNLLSAEQYLQWWRPRIAVSRYGWSGGWLDGPFPTGTGNDLTSTWTPYFLEEGQEIPEGYETMVDPLTGRIITFQDTDLQDLLYRTALQTNYNFSATGGSENLRYATSLGYTHQEGVAIGSDYERMNGRMNLNFDVTDNFSMGTSGDFSYSKTSSFRDEADIFTRGVLNAPTIRHRFEDGTPGWGTNGSLANPMWVVETRDVNDQRIIGTFGVNFNWEIMKNLSLSGNNFFYGSLSMFDYFEKAHTFSDLREATASRDFLSRRQSEILLKYNKTIGSNHNFDFLLGYSDLYYKTENAGLAASGGSTDAIPTLNGAPTKTEASTFISEEKLISQFARLNYNFDKKYLLSASIRRDGSSKFLGENQFGYFPSFSAGWVISNEKFLEDNQTISLLKFRGSYGVTGNNDVGRYSAQGNYNAGYSYAGNAAVVATNMPNFALTWEKTFQTDLGFDIGLFKRRIEMSGDVYKRRTEDLLFTVELPRESGFGSVEQNIGIVEYKGLEFEFISRNIIKTDFTWTTHFNIAYNVNEVIKLPFREGIDKNRINGTILPDGTGYGGIAEGEPLGAIIGYKVDYLIDNEEQANNALYDESANGYDPRTGQLIGRGTKFPGDYEWVDRNGDGRITSLDRFVLGNAMPTTTGGMNNSFSYRNFSLNVFLDFMAGHSIMDNVRPWMNGNMARRVATTTDVLSAWQKPGDAAYTNQARSDYHDQNHQSNLRSSNLIIQKGDYISLRNVTLSYTFPESVFQNRLQNFELFLTGNNLLYFTEYDGPNPENGGTISHSSGNYPVFRTFSVGANIKL